MNRKNKKNILCIACLIVFLIAGACVAFFDSQNTRGLNETKEEKEYTFYQAERARLDDPEDVGVMILDCDELSTYNSVVNATTIHRTGKYVQGTGAMDVVDFFNISPTYVLFNKVDISNYADGSIHVSVYVNDPERLNGAPLLLELSSSGTCDEKELSWEIPAGFFSSGWNEVYLAIEDATVIGEPDLTSLNYFRVFTMEAKIGLDVIIDSIYATDTAGMDISAIAEASKITASTKDGMVLDFDTLDGLSSSGAISLSTAKGEYKEGKAAVLIQNPNELWIEANLKKLDLSRHQKGRLSFWVYVSDASLVKNGTVCMELTSSGTYDKNEISWNFPGADLKTGWNEVTLSIGTGTKTPDGVNFTNINYMRIYGVDCSKDLCVILDGVSILPPAVRVANDGMLLDCDTEEKIKVSSHNEFNITTAAGEYQQGTGAFKSVGKGTVWWEVGMEELVDISKYKDGGIHLYLYVSDPTKLKSNVAIELGSGGICDVDEYQWNVSGLKAGWNELELEFASAIVLGKPDLSNIDYFRIFAECSDTVTVMLDDVRAVNITLEIPALKEGQLLSGDSLLHAKKLFGDTAVYVTNAVDEYKEGTGAYKSEGKGQVRIEAVLREAVDLSAYKEGGLSFWLYVGDKSEIASTSAFVEISSAGEFDKQELQWDIPLANLQENSWNEVELKFSDAQTAGGAIDLSAVDYFRIFLNQNEQSEKALFIIDDVHAIEIEKEEEPEQELKAGQLLSGDSLFNVTKLYGDTAVSITNVAEEYKEGAGAYKSEGTGQVRIEAVLKEAIDLSAYKEGGLSFWMYVGDKSEFTSTNIAVEITSDGKPDSSELEWKIALSELTENSWNKVTLSFTDATAVGNIDFSTVNYFRIWLEQYEQSDKALLILDDVHGVEIENTEEEPEPEPEPELKAGQLLSGDSLFNVTKLYGDTAVSITNVADEYQEGAGAYKSEGIGQVRIEAVLEKAIDLSTYKEGSISFWLYVGDKTAFSSDTICIEITSAGVSDNNELEWRIPLSGLIGNSWNEIKLSFADAQTVGNIDFSAVNYFRMYLNQYEQNSEVLLIVDDVHGVEVESKQLLSCDDESNAELHPWVPVTITSETGKYKEGTGAYQSVGAGQERFKVNLKEAIDISEYRDGALTLWLYVGDKSAFSSNTICIEITSSGASDSNELEWKIPLSELEGNKWNKITLLFADAQTIGIIDYSAVNYFRLYLDQNEQSSEVLLIVDDVKAIQVSKVGQFMSCDDTSNVELASWMPITITNVAGAYKEGTGAYQRVGTDQVRFQGNFKQPIDISAYKDGILTFWLYVDDKKKLASSCIYLELSSSGTSDEQELEWTIETSELVEFGWNKIKVNFKDARTVGEINLTQVNFFRLFLNMTESQDVITIIDDFRAGE